MSPSATLPPHDTAITGPASSGAAGGAAPGPSKSEQKVNRPEMLSRADGDSPTKSTTATPQRSQAGSPPVGGIAIAGSRPPEAEYQWLFSKNDLELTPSVLEAGMTSSEERLLRAKGIQTIYRIGDFMRLGQHVLSTACIFFHRFYMRKPLQYGPSRLGHSHYEVAAACVFLACKVEETHRKLPSVIEATMASLDKSPAGQQKLAEKTYRVDPNSKEFGRWRDIILVSEEVLLEALAFDLIIDHPHEVLVKASFRLGIDKTTARLAWTIINDSMRDPTCVMYEAPVLAAGAFLKACRTAGKDPSSYRAPGPQPQSIGDAGTGDVTGSNAGAAAAAEGDAQGLDWTAVFDVAEEEAEEVCEAIEQDVYGFHGGSQSSTSNATSATAPPSGAASAVASKAATPVPTSQG